VSVGVQALPTSTAGNGSTSDVDNDNRHGRALVRFHFGRKLSQQVSLSLARGPHMCDGVAVPTTGLPQLFAAFCGARFKVDRASAQFVNGKHDWSVLL
jgi:hypothetical protein